MADTTSLSKDDRIQVQAFKSFFRLSEGNYHERLVRAICLSSDESFSQMRRRDPPRFAAMRRRLLELSEDDQE